MRMKGARWFMSGFGQKVRAASPLTAAEAFPKHYWGGMLHSANCVLLSVAVYHPWQPHCYPPGIDNPEHWLIRKHEVGPILLCPLLIFLVCRTWDASSSWSGSTAASSWQPSKGGPPPSGGQARPSSQKSCAANHGLFKAALKGC